MSDHREQQCIKLLDALEPTGRVGLTRKDFAAVLGITKSQYLNGLIDELVSRNLAEMTPGKMPNGLPVYVYFKVVK